MSAQRLNASTHSRCGNAVIAMLAVIGAALLPVSSAAQRQQFGQDVINHIAHYDAGTGKHFYLLQLEVLIPDAAEFEKVHRGLEDQSDAAMAEVERIVTSHIDSNASETFKKALKLGFEDKPTRGTVVIDRIAHYDAGTGQHWYIMQCEVPIPDAAEFEKVHAGLENKSGPEVERIVTSRIDPKASKNFKEVIRLGFEGQ